MDAKTWWRSAEDVDEDQRKFLTLPPDQEATLLLGPPGSGKTNILLLRAIYLFRSGLPNVRVVTFNRTLTEFIKSGAEANGKISASQITTNINLQLGLVHELTGRYVGRTPGQSFDEFRHIVSREAVDAVRHAGVSNTHYDALLIDEVQDLWRDELVLFRSLTKRLFVAGDGRQRIYDRNEGIATATSELGCEVHRLVKHYRIGRAICRAADRILSDDTYLLDEHCQYNEAASKSSVKLHLHKDWEEQAINLIRRLDSQLRAFPNEWLAVIAPTREALKWIVERLESSHLSDKVKAHKTYQDNADRTFDSSRPICVVTAHSAKGTEFRAVHLFAGEKLRRNVRQLGFTVITRAKTALDVYACEDIRAELQSALSEERVATLEELFNE